jgi:hypothetical protein
LDLANTPLSGAVVTLLNSSYTQIGQVTTGASGYYKFDGSNVTGGTLGPGTYQIVETPPSGYVNQGSSITSPVNPATQVTPSTIKVTLEDPTYIHLDSNGPGQIIEDSSLSGSGNTTFAFNPTPTFAYAGPQEGEVSQMIAHVDQTNGSTSPSATAPDFNTFCVDLYDNVNVGDFYPAAQREASSGVISGGEIAYLYNHFGVSTFTGASANDQASALQIAIWTLEYGSAFSYSGPLSNQVQTYLNAAAGKSEEAIYLDSTQLGNPPEQAMLAPSQLNFTNAQDRLGLLVLDPTDKDTLNVNNGSVTVNATNNGIGSIVVDSNNTSQEALRVAPGAFVSAGDIDVTGSWSSGTVGTTGNYRPNSPHHEAAIADPLSLPLPPAPTTTFAALTYSSSSPLTLSPGTYIGGIQISGSGTITFQPGIYYMQGGGFSYNGSTGGQLKVGPSSGGLSGVLIVNAPSRSSDTINFNSSAAVNLPGITGLTGALAPYNGIVLFQDPASTNSIKISTSTIISFTGIIYSPKGFLSVSNGGMVVNFDATHSISEVIVYEAEVNGGSLTINVDPPPAAPSSGGSQSGGTSTGSGTSSGGKGGGNKNKTQAVSNTASATTGGGNGSPGIGHLAKPKAATFDAYFAALWETESQSDWWLV